MSYVSPMANAQRSAAELTLEEFREAITATKLDFWATQQIAQQRGVPEHKLGPVKLCKRCSRRHPARQEC